MGNQIHEWHDLCERLYALGQQLQLKLEMSRTDRRKNLVIILYSRVLVLFQQILEQCDESQAAVPHEPARDLLDTVFATLAAIMDRRLVDDFYIPGDRQRIYRRKIHQSLPRDVAGRVRQLSGGYFAQFAGMSDYYLILRNHIDSTAGDPTPDTLYVPVCEAILLATRQVADFFQTGEINKEYYLCWRDFVDLTASP